MGACTVLVGYEGCRCKLCGSSIVPITWRLDDLEEFDSEDWLIYCCSPACDRHKPEGLGQSLPDWVDGSFTRPSESAMRPAECNSQPEPRIVAIFGGGDWYDASVDYLVVPAGMDLDAEKEAHSKWWRSRSKGEPYKDFPERLIERGAARATQIEEFPA